MEVSLLAISTLLSLSVASFPSGDTRPDVEDRCRKEAAARDRGANLPRQAFRKFAPGLLRLAEEDSGDPATLAGRLAAADLGSTRPRSRAARGYRDLIASEGEGMFGRWSGRDVEMSDELRYFQGLDYRPPHCLEVAESSGYEGGHCAECHGDNFSGHECLIEVKLAGGDSAEVCGPMLAWLRSNGHLDPAEDARAICEETFNLFIEEGS